MIRVFPVVDQNCPCKHYQFKSRFWLLLTSMMTVVEFYSEAGDIQWIFAPKWTSLKDFYSFNIFSDHLVFLVFSADFKHRE